MRAVKSAGTRPEAELAEALKKRGLRPKAQARALPGSPDFYFPKERAAVFLHGCFWHGHACRRGARLPATNAAYWRAKIARNQRRDRAAARALRAKGVRVFVVWECRKAGRAADRIARALLKEGNRQ